MVLGALAPLGGGLCAQEAARASAPYETQGALAVGVAAASAALYALHPEYRGVDLDAEARRLGPDSVFVLDRWALGPDSKAARRYSDLSLYALAATPLLVLGSQAEWSGDFALLTGMTAQVAALTWLVTTRTKAVAQRRRPYLFNPRLPPDARVARALDDGEPLESFFSGHTSVAFAAAMFATTAWGDLEGWSDGKRRLRLLALGAAGTTGVARILGGQHHPTDVVVGALVGMGIGYLIPRLHRRDGGAPGTPGASGPAGGQAVRPVWVGLRIPVG